MPESAHQKLKNSGEAADEQTSLKREAGQVVMPCKMHWIEIELVGEDNKGIPNENYIITLPDGKAFKGKTDKKGCARIERIPEGICQVTFPDLDKDAWESIQ